MRPPQVARSLFAVAVLIIAGCVSAPQHGHVRRLLAFPGFDEAGKAAPGWTVEALDTVALLEYELAKAQR